MTKPYGKHVKQPKPDSMAARYPDKETPDETSPAHERALVRHDERKRLVAVAETIAKNGFFYRNWKWPTSDTRYPNDPDMRVVDKCYPNAAGGTLLVDEPRDLAQAQRCYEKQKILKNLGFRHIVIEETPAPTTVYDALTQLGEL